MRTLARPNPQRLDTLVGKILRIIPDPAEHVATSTLSENGRDPSRTTTHLQPSLEPARNVAYGPQSAPVELGRGSADSAEHLIAAVIGLRTWEMVNIIRKGANYGYSQREGNQLLQPDNVIAALPAVDKIAVQIGDTVTDEIGGADLPGCSVWACANWRRRYRQRIRLHRQGAAGPARQVHLHGPFHGTCLVRRLKDMLAADDGDRRRWRRSTK